METGRSVERGGIALSRDRRDHLLKQSRSRAPSGCRNLHPERRRFHLEELASGVHRASRVPAITRAPLSFDPARSADYLLFASSKYRNAESISRRRKDTLASVHGANPSGGRFIPLISPALSRLIAPAISPISPSARSTSRHPISNTRSRYNRDTNFDANEILFLGKHQKPLDPTDRSFRTAGARRGRW